jgi:hypothetical protein
MIKFGVLRADADGISLIGLHFVEVRQRSLCWRTSGRTLGYSWLRQTGICLCCFIANVVGLEMGKVAFAYNEPKAETRATPS